MIFKLIVWISIVKMAVALKASYSINVVLSKIPVSFFIDIETTVLKFIWNKSTLEQSRP